MSKTMADKTTAAAERGPLAPCQSVGISPLVRAELDKLGDEKRDRVLEHVARKG
jgi:hypothetical protein